MRLDAIASEVHFCDHIMPTWLALPEEARGYFFVPYDLTGHVHAAGITPYPYAEPKALVRQLAGRDTTVMSVAYRDLTKALANVRKTGVVTSRYMPYQKSACNEREH